MNNVAEAALREEFTMDTKNLVENFPNLAYCSRMLTCYHDVLENSVGRALIKLLDAMALNDTNQAGMILAYSNLFKALVEAEPTGSLATFLMKRVLASDNPYSRAKDPTQPTLSNAVLIDIETIQRLASLESEGLREEIRRRYIVAGKDDFLNLVGHLPLFNSVCEEPSPDDLNSPRSAWRLMFRSLKYALEHKRLVSCIPQLAEFYQKYGTGKWNLSYAYAYRNGALKPIPNLNLPEANAFIDYSGNLARLKEEVDAFAQHKRRQHVLLTGVQGTGKSSAIHWALGQHKADNLMLIALRKEELFNLDELFEALETCPQQVILFFDDLSFTAIDDDYLRLKAYLEGELRSVPEHCAIYATSNLCQLMREEDSDEQNEQLPLSPHFGLHLHFPQPVQCDYLTIVEYLFNRANQTWTDKVKQEALQFAKQKGHYTPRTAQQFLRFWS